jgi:DNA-binding Lrp family transcriptional regulator
VLKDILKILENDARTSVKQIATMTGMPAAEVTKLIGQAEKDRVILKYKTVVNWDRVEENGQVWALIEVKVKPEPEAGFDSVAERIARYQQVRSLYLASGTYDLLLVVVGKSEHQVADFVSQNLAHIKGVQGTVTHFILKRYKDDGEALDGGEGEKRQPVIL